MSTLNKCRAFSFAILLAALAVSHLAVAQDSDSGVPVSMVVTVEARRGNTMPEITKQDVMVYQGRTRAKVTDWVPAQGDRAGLQLFVLLDDYPNASRGRQLDDIRRFIMAQPAATKVGVAYMQIGDTKVLQAPTIDHQAAADALRVTLGSLAGSASPYFSLGDLIKHWNASSDRREVLMISNGIDGINGGDHDDPYVNAVIQKAQRGGIQIFAISTTGPSLGRKFLAQLSEETGGESYYHESGPPVSFAPYLDTFSQRLANQYLLTFLAKPEKKAGMQSVKLRTEVPNAVLLGASSVYVPAP
jgi:hypothetical protein